MLVLKLLTTVIVGLIKFVNQTQIEWRNSIYILNVTNVIKQKVTKYTLLYVILFCFAISSIYVFSIFKSTTIEKWNSMQCVPFKKIQPYSSVTPCAYFGVFLAQNYRNSTLSSKLDRYCVGCPKVIFIWIFLNFHFLSYFSMLQDVFNYDKSNLFFVIFKNFIPSFPGHLNVEPH